MLFYRVLWFFAVNDVDSDQVFTGMAYDPYTGVMFLSSPKVTGRRVAVSFFRVDKFGPGSLPALTPFPYHTSGPIVSN